LDYFDDGEAKNQLIALFDFIIDRNNWQNFVTKYTSRLHRKRLFL
jgi:hypothetical protein